MIQSNATITSVAVGVDRDAEWNAPEGDGASKFAGAQRAYLLEETDTQAGGGGETVVLVRSLIVPSAWATDLGLSTFDRLTVDTDDERPPFVARATDLAISELVGIPAEFQTARVTFDEA